MKIKLLTLDFETYYAQDFTLSKLSTESYIRDPRFEVIGVSVKVDDGVPVWHTGTKKSIAAFLNTYDWENSAALAHNAMFDMAILNWHFDIRPKIILDTLCMARATHTIEVGGSLAALAKYYGVGEKGHEVIEAKGKRRLDFTPTEIGAYGGYCDNDVELTHKIFLPMLPGFPLTELKLIDLTLRMFTEPVIELDKQLLVEHLADVKQRKAEMLASVAPDISVLRSKNKFADLLRSYGVEPPMKISPTTGKETYAFAKTDEGLKELLEHENETIRTLVAVRLGVQSSIEETRTERFIGIAERGTLPVPLRYYAAHTGRWGGDDKINMQNLKRDSKLKYAMCAPTGYTFIDYDLSQIEARVLAWLAGQDDLVAAFDRGDDVYTIMASRIYNKSEAEITKPERFVGKMTILGCGYGMGWRRFQEQLKTFGVEIEDEQAERIIRVYRDSYPKIVQLWYQAGDAIKLIAKNQEGRLGKRSGFTVEGAKGIRLPNGLYMKYPNVREELSKDYEPGDPGRKEWVYDTKKGRTIIPNRIYGGKVVENICQAAARIVMGEQLLRVAKKYKVAMTVHDAMGCLVKDDEVDEAYPFIEKNMRIRPTWAPTLPLDCEGGLGGSYGFCGGFAWL